MESRFFLSCYCLFEGFFISKLIKEWNKYQPKEGRRLKEAERGYKNRGKRLDDVARGCRSSLEVVRGCMRLLEHV
jgi:hypothetical protein